MRTKRSLRYSTIGLTIGLIACSDPLPLEAQAPEPVGMEVVAFFRGQWDVESLTADGNTVIGRARTEVTPILDGQALKSDYIGLGPAGGVLFRGVTVRTWVPQLQRFAIHWAVAGQADYTYLLEEYRDGDLIAEGHGRDGGGEFLERYRYSNLSDSTYTFEGERSYDGGTTWNPFARLRATKR